MTGEHDSGWDQAMTTSSWESCVSILVPVFLSKQSA